MNYKAIIKEAWALTQENRKLIWYFAFIPAVLESLVSMVYMTYQVSAFWTSEYLRPAAKNAPHAIELVFKAIGRIFHLNVGLGVFLVISAAILIALYLLLPVFSEGALIQLIAKLRGGHKVTMVEGVGYGFTRFLQLFEYNIFKLQY